jgi:hypothetical protein
MGYPPHPQQPAYPPAVTPPRTNGLAVASLILGVTGFITCGFTSILAVAFGHVALHQINRDGSDGRGMALSGTILGWFLTGAWILFWALSITGTISTALYSAAVPADPGPARTRLDVAPQPNASQPGQAVQPGDGGHAVVLEAVGKDGASSANNVTYSIKYSIKQEQGVPLPYSKEVTTAAPYPMSLWVQNAGADGVIECRILVDGQVVREATSSGPYGVCNVRADAP